MVCAEVPGEFHRSVERESLVHFVGLNYVLVVSELEETPPGAVAKDPLFFLVGRF